MAGHFQGQWQSGGHFPARRFHRQLKWNSTALRHRAPGIEFNLN
jgi:hypothetical protein